MPNKYKYAKKEQNNLINSVAWLKFLKIIVFLPKQLLKGGGHVPLITRLILATRHLKGHIGDKSPERLGTKPGSQRN
jgi:hypothetical protein